MAEKMKASKMAQKMKVSNLPKKSESYPYGIRKIKVSNMATEK